jgi:hypothetical protein
MIASTKYTRSDGVGWPVLASTENADDAVTFDEGGDGGVGRHGDRVIGVATGSSAR